jgi:2-methylcitrate dehydratase
LRVTRTGALSNWKGLAYPNTAFGCTHATFLAMRGITGPPEVFEGNKGFMDAISGPFKIDWAGEDLERVTMTIVKKYNAEIHSQSAIEGILEMKVRHGFSAKDVERVEIDTFNVAFNIIGGGEEGDKTIVRTKEQADHSLQYMVSAAILDGRVTPEQYTPERIGRSDVQNLLKKVTVRPVASCSARFPREMPCILRVFLKDGKQFSMEKRDYEGFFTNPFGWEKIVEKFESLCSPWMDASMRREIVDMVCGLENITTRELTQILTRVQKPGV